MVLNVAKNHTLKIATHILIWLVLFAFPYFLSSEDKFRFDFLFVVFWQSLFYSACIFYLNYFIFIDRFFFKRKIGIFCLINVFVILIFSLIAWFVRFKVLKIHEPFNFRPANIPPPSTNIFIYKDLFSFLIPIVFSTTVRTMENWIKIEKEKKETEKENLKSELQHLKYQLHPHFFFNSLNNIYSLIDNSPEKAKETIHSLGKLMRYFLYDTNLEKVNLSSEMEFIRKYIGLMKIRISDKTSILIDFQDISNDIQVAPLLFISIIENAFKHGISATKNSTISFQLTMRQNKLCFISENENFPKNESDKSGSGIGLINLRKRLELLYPNKHILESSIIGNKYRIEMTIEIDTV